MTGCEARVEAWFRGYLPEGPVEDFTRRQQRVYGLAGVWRECFGSYGENHGATLGCLLALACEVHECPTLQCGHTGGWGDDWDTWLVGNPPGRGHGCRIAGQGATKLEALVSALDGGP